MIEIVVGLPGLPKSQGSLLRLSWWKPQRGRCPGRHDGHDLSRRDDGRYLVSTDNGVWVFDPGTGDFASFPALNPKLMVKAVSQAGDRLAWIQAEESWWAKGFQIARADGSHPVRVPVDGLHLYKVCWIR